MRLAKSSPNLVKQYKGSLRTRLAPRSKLRWTRCKYFIICIFALLVSVRFLAHPRTSKKVELEDTSFQALLTIDEPPPASPPPAWPPPVLPPTRVRHVRHRQVSDGAPKSSEINNPFSTEWSNKILGCAIANREATSDVREWIQYHRCA